MPELPEVETVVRGLQKSLPGRQIVGVRVGKADFIDDASALERMLPGSRISAVRRCGKFIDVDLTPANSDLAATEINASPNIHISPNKRSAPNISLIIHLGMTGQLTVQRHDSPAAAHTHVYFELENGYELRYTDIRRFGRIAAVPSSQREIILGALGLDPLETTEEQFLERFGSRHARVKALLMDQRVLRGMGNIYTDESLWRARIHPARIASSLNRDALRRLYGAVQEVLSEAIALRGSSISDYVDSEGQRGEFQLRHRVYDREGEKCFHCGSLIRRIIVAGRSSYFCPRCQPAPRTRKNRTSKRHSSRTAKAKAAKTTKK